MNLRRFALGSGALLSARLITAAAQVGIGVTLARQFAVDDVAVYFFFYNISLVGGLLLNLGIGVAGVRFISALRDDGRLRRLAVARVVGITAWFAVAFVLLGSAAAGAGLLSGASGLPGIADHGWLAIIWIASNSLRISAHESLLALGYPAAAALFSGLASSLLTLAGIAVVVAVAGTPSIGLVLGLAVGSAVFATVAALVVLARRSAEATRPSPDQPVSIQPPTNTELLRAGLPLMLSTAISSRRKELLVAILAAVSTAEAVVLLGLANQMVAVVAMPIVAATGMIMPEIARYASHGRLREQSQHLRTLWTITLTPVVVIALGLIAWSEQVVTAVYGAVYAGVTQVAVVSILGRLVSIVSGPTSQTLAMTGRQNVLLALSAVEFVPLMLLGVLLGQRYGAIGGAWAFTVSVTITALASTAYIRVKLGIWVFAWIFPGKLRTSRGEVATS